MSDIDPTSPPRTRRLSFWLMIFGLGFLVSLGLCGISLKTHDDGGRLAVLSIVGMALSIAGLVIALLVAFLSALIRAGKR